ncbi:antitoxin Xre/MbcA/ParS toxin-binding domain-containing protein [Nocardioides alcanivorans]|uniref:antitoxin Xre/MbcA/ParS toxin-binding domain-containing protein n=1 Tax=Nocardioides alcanivorans TaxID=2897352 RepID=UPI001F1C302C|nr:antitoxin Xre/MbcA/ParS toxin-binding domain-containing protein [Nocardioides alcanivorans]
MAEQVGPDFYDEAAMREALSADTEPLAAGELRTMVEQGAVLGLRTADEQWIFPTWQVRDHAVLAGLADAIQEFEGHPLWSIGLWLTTPHEDLDDLTPVQALETRDAVDLVRDLASDTADRWA